MPPTKHRYNKKNYYRATDQINVCSTDEYNNYKVNTVTVPARIKEFDGKPIQAFKKAWMQVGRKNKSGYYSTVKCVVELLVPARAIRFQPRNKKCRASSAQVVAIYEIVSGRRYGQNKLGKKSRKKEAFSCHDTRFKYTVGKKVKPKEEAFNKNHRSECAAGIHFFLTAKEAANY